MLDGVDLDVPEGTIFALLRPNGAGLDRLHELCQEKLADRATRGSRRPAKR